MPRATVAFALIVAAFAYHAAAGTACAEDVPVSPAVMALARRLDVDPVRSPSRFMADMAAAVYVRDGTAADALASFRAPTEPTAAGVAPVVPVPLSAAVWSRSVFRRPVSPGQLAAAILADRRAALLCRGLAALDDETLEYLVRSPSTVQFLYERASSVFAAFGGALRIRGGRVVPPGGSVAAPLWESVVTVPLTDPARFVSLLYSVSEGRLAYLYDVIAAADGPAARFALGLWLDEGVRTSRFRTLADAVGRSYREWHVTDRPFSRPLGDLALLLLRIRLDPSGAPAAPADRDFWALALGAAAEPPAGTTPAAEGARMPRVIDAAWLVSATGDGDMYRRMVAVDQFSFGQRMFNVVPETPALVEIVRRFPRNRMLLLTFERLGLRSPATYLAALRRADALGEGDSSRRFAVLAQFQGALAFAARLQRAGTLAGPGATEPLIQSLVAVPLADDGYAGGIAQWVRADLSRVLPAGDTWEDRAIGGLAGPGAGARAPRLFWEGQSYRLDAAYAERDRLVRVRDKQRGQTLDLALSIDEGARLLASPGLTPDAVRRVAAALGRVAGESAAELRRPVVNLLPAGVPAERDGLEWIRADIEELSRIARTGEWRRVAKVGESLQQLADTVLGHVLISYAYAADIGDPDGASLLAGNVALRHDFGLAHVDGDGRARIPWDVPRQDFRPGVPWHVTGSLLGLDVALAPLNLRRIAIDRVADAPKISSIEREAFAVGVSLMDPRRLNDADRDALAVAIERGRARIGAVASGLEPVEGVADALGFDGWRRRALAWAVAREPGAVSRQFALTEMLALGGGAPGADLDAWGTPGLHIDGCLCLRFPRPAAWRMLEGRAQLPMMAATMGDLSLAVALALRDLRLPAALARPVLEVATQDFIDGLGSVNGDWLSLSQAAQAISRRRIEDYVSAAAAVGGPLVPEETESPGEN